MPTLTDPKQFPESGRIVNSTDFGLSDTDTLLSFNQAYSNAAYPPNTNKENEFDGENLTWTTNLHTELPIRFNKLGYSSKTPITLAEAFSNAMKKWGPLPALHYKPKGKLNEPFITFTWKEYYDKCCKFAKSLMSLKMSDKQVVCIMGFNQPAWLIADLGSVLANCIPSGIYPTSTPYLVNYILNHSEAGVILCDTLVNVDKVLEVKKDVPHLIQIVLYYDELTPYYRSQGVVSFEEFCEFGNGINNESLFKKMYMQKPGECSSLIYTSGTTTLPKAVMISHDNATWTGYITSQYTLNNPSQRVISYLPLSHIAAQMIDCICPLFSGHQVFFANIDALQGSLLASLQEIKPSWLLGVPRVWEKLEMGFKSALANSSPMKKKLMSWVQDIGYQGTMALLQGSSPPKSYPFVDQFFLNKIRKQLGFDQCFGMAVSGAPVNPSTQKFFLSIGMPLFIMYGLSETTGPHCFSASAPHWLKLGSSGFTINGVETLIKDPDSSGVGEICCRGRHVFMGYYKDKQSTKQVIDKHGFFKTGDTASYDSDGMIYIEGRIKDLVITAGGENIPPILIENYVKDELPFVSNCIVIGDYKPYLSLLICLEAELDSKGHPSINLTQKFIQFLKSQGSESTTTIEAANDTILKNIIDKSMKNVNKKVASRAQEIRKWHILPKDFSIQTGELTPSLKLKRSAVIKKEEALINWIYDSSNNKTQSKL